MPVLVQCTRVGLPWPPVLMWIEVSPRHIGAKGLVLNHSYCASPIKYHQEGACGPRIALAATHHAPKSGCSSSANMALLYSVGHSIYRDRGGVVAVASFLNPPQVRWEGCR